MIEIPTNDKDALMLILSITHASHRLETIPTADFRRAWQAMLYVYPGLHPDGFDTPGSGWPKKFHPIAAEAWRRYDNGELADEEFYCAQAAAARLNRERDKTLMALKWRLRFGLLYAGLSSQCQPILTDIEHAIVFDGRDNEESKAAFYGAILGCKFEVEKGES